MLYLGVESLDLAIDIEVLDLPLYVVLEVGGVGARCALPGGGAAWRSSGGSLCKFRQEEGSK